MGKGDTATDTLMDGPDAAILSHDVKIDSHFVIVIG